ncbi:MAG: hypothetical protein QGG48_04635 [Desulfatiglandales bacterium]|nr:hypothetical protein [Desulfatiglandales bacterium]
MLFFILSFSSAIPENMNLAEIAVIKVHFRHAFDMPLLVETMLLPEGRVAVDSETNSFIISGGAESLKRIRKFLMKLDKPVPQFKIRFRFQEEGLSKSKSFKVSGRVSGKRWSVTGGGRGKNEVSLSAREKR